MDRRNFLKSAGSVTAAGAIGASLPVGARALTPAATSEQPGSPQQPRAATQRFDIHTHFYTQSFFEKIRARGGQFSVTTPPAGRTTTDSDMRAGANVLVAGSPSFRRGPDKNPANIPAPPGKG